MEQRNAQMPVCPPSDVSPGQSKLECLPLQLTCPGTDQLLPVSASRLELFIAKCRNTAAHNSANKALVTMQGSLMTPDQQMQLRTFTLRLRPHTPGGQYSACIQAYYSTLHVAGGPQFQPVCSTEYSASRQIHTGLRMWVVYKDQSPLYPSFTVAGLM
jgi:hypothetical protein